MFLSRYACPYERPRNRQETAWSSVANELYCPVGNTMCTCFSPEKLCPMRRTPPVSLLPQRCCRGSLPVVRYPDGRQTAQSRRLCCHFGCFAFSPTAPSASIYTTDDRLILIPRSKATSAHLKTPRYLWSFLWSFEVGLLRSCILYQ